MRILFCSLASPGFLHPQIRVALALRARGHEVAFVTGRSFAPLLEAEGLHRIPRTHDDGESFGVRTWATPLSVALDARHVEYALSRFEPSLLVGQPLALAPYLCSERHRLPLVVMGLAAYLWPRWDRRPHASAMTDEELRLQWRLGDMVGHYNAARRALGLREVTLGGFHDHPLLGDRFLVQSVPELEGVTDEELPPRVTLSGHWLWEPPQVDPRVASFLADAAAAGEPVIYAQPGRSFDGRPWWPSLVEALDGEPVRVVASLGRMDGPAVALSDRFLALPHVAQGAVLPHAALAVGCGHSTGVLGALAAGTPLVLLPNGSGTEDIAARCQRRGAAVLLDAERAGAPELRRTIRDALADPVLAERARGLAAALACVDGGERAADVIERAATRSAAQNDLPSMI